MSRPGGARRVGVGAAVAVPGMGVALVVRLGSAGWGERVGVWEAVNSP